jgi:HD-like signal output (HDOD) protein/signal transduction histidine kinase
LTIESMELVRLPSPPHLLSKLLDVCHDPDSSVSELAALISTDVALTSHLIMALNSDVFAINEPVNNPEQAINLLGHDLVKTMVLTASIQQLFAGLINTRKQFVCNAWLDSLYCAVFAQDIARVLNYEHLQDAYLAGLLHDFGQIVFDAKFHEQYIDVVDADNEVETISREVSKFGVSHTELGACVIEQWSSLSPAIADAARFHHEDDAQLRGCDILCQIVAEACEIAWYWSRFGKADPKWHSRLISDHELKKIYVHAQVKIYQTAGMLGITLTKSRSLTQEQFAKDIEKETIKVARKIRDASLIKVINPEETLAPILDSPRSLLLKVAQEMQLLFSISDVALLFPDPNNSDFLALYEVKHAQPVSKFSVEENNGQIVKCFVDKSSCWIEPGDRHDGGAPISDRQIIRRLNHEIAFSLPLGNGEKVIGVIVIGSSKEQKNALDKLSKFIVGYLKNITDVWLKNSQALQKQAFEDNLKQEQEQKDVDKLVHEISNPLSVISNYIDIIKANSASQGSKNDKEIKILKEELLRIGNIVSNFRDAKNVRARPLFLNDELKACIPLYVKSISKGKEVKITWNLDESDAEINISSDALRQIVLNLVKNSVEAKTIDPEILVSSHHFVNIDGAAFAQFVISDRGRGIDAITRQNLFTAATSTKRGTNRGLGLSVVAEILNNFKGHIKYMENEGGGASFEVLVPLQLRQT